jgi:hypothetical protein
MSRIARDLASSPHNETKKNGFARATEESITNMQAALRAGARRGASTTPSVAVVGAGIAGLRCADVLSRSGCRVTLFEARSRVGGRVHQVESGGFPMDMGANWIHGTEGNPIMKLARQTETVVVEPKEGGALFDVDGQRRPDSEAVELSAKVWEMIVGAFQYSDQHTAQIDPNTSLWDHFRQALDHERSEEKKKDLLREAQMWGPFVGDPIEQQSLKFFFLEECIEGENVFVASTYKNILAKIGEAVTGPDSQVDLRLDTEIVHFEIARDEDVGKDSSGRVTVTTAAGEKASFDDVVVSCPLGWLKRNLAAFSPPLPQRLSQAIDSINYGRLEKLYVTFPQAFWLRRSPGEEDDDDDKDQETDVDTSRYPIFTHFHDPRYVPHPQGEAWNQSVVSLAHMPEPCAHPTLLFYMYGPCGSHLVESIKDLVPQSDEYNKTLTAFASPFYSRLPTYSPTDPMCKPVAFLATQWQADRFAGHGSYCNFQTGLQRGDEDIEVMRAAATSQGLWLAGEHTAPFIALGTTTGAWWSGEGVARRLCEVYGLAVPPDVSSAPEDDATKRKDLDSAKPDAANLNGLAI